MVSQKQSSRKKKVIPENKGRRVKLTKFIKPMLAKETDTVFDDSEWLFEIKWDGYRAISEIKDGEVALYSRNGNSFNTSYPIVYNELKKLKHDMVLDGEIVIINEEGKSDFQKLQHYEDNTQYPIRYYVFDLLFLNGQNVQGLPLIQRKELLRKALPKNAVIKYSEHILTKGKDFFAAAKKQDLEGIMAKKAASQYHPGVRTNEWLKIKHHKSQEVIIAGFTAPTGSRQYFGALVLGIYMEGKLKYVGHTGSGFNDKDLKNTYSLLKPLIQKDSPFDEVVKTNMPVTWVKPKLIGEIKFTEWTNDKKMRHPIFLGLRDDKSLKEITMATTKTVTAPKTKKGNKKEEDSGISFGKIKVKVTNQDKIYFPDDKVTKGMVIDYYQQVAEYILPYLKDRPQSLKRNPNGITDNGFFHKDAGDEAPEWVKSIKIYSDSAKKDTDYIICNDKQTLAYLNNLGCIELNPWNSTTKKLDNPDYMIIDIDPSEKNTFEQVIETALTFKKIFDKAGADCYCKTSGATGLHIFVPMGKKYDYEQVKDFAQFVCMLVNDALPAFTSMERNLKKRGNKNIYLDYLQNRRGQTISSVYSLRPKKGATVSTPLLWKEIKTGLHPSSFTIKNTLVRIKKMKDIFSGVLGKGVDIKKCLTALS
jgi:bifunctional non-homologous end joining protein LigD